MIDREKVIRGLECCAGNGKGKECIYKEPVQDCPYENLCVGYDDIDTYYECTTALAADALELLKRQEKITVADLFRQFTDDVRMVWDGRPEEVKQNDRC